MCTFITSNTIKPLSISHYHYDYPDSRRLQLNVQKSLRAVDFSSLQPLCSCYLFSYFAINKYFKEQKWVVSCLEQPKAYIEILSTVSLAIPTVDRIPLWQGKVKKKRWRIEPHDFHSIHGRNNSKCNQRTK